MQSCIIVSLSRRRKLFKNIIIGTAHREYVPKVFYSKKIRKKFLDNLQESIFFFENKCQIL